MGRAVVDQPGSPMDRRGQAAELAKALLGRGRSGLTDPAVVDVFDDGDFVVVVVSGSGPGPLQPVAVVVVRHGSIVVSAVDGGDRSVVNRRGPDVEFHELTVEIDGRISFVVVFGRHDSMAGSFAIRRPTGNVAARPASGEGLFAIGYTPGNRPSQLVVLDKTGRRVRGTMQLIA